MITKTGKIHNEYGIHCRPSSLIQRTVKGYEGKIEVISASGAKANPQSALAILTLTLACGDSFTVRVEGPDEEKMADKMVEMLEAKYEFKKE